MDRSGRATLSGDDALSASQTENLAPKMASLFAAGREEAFEDGMESEFSRGLVSLLEQHGAEAVEAVRHLVLGEKVNAEVASEALRWIGDIDQPDTRGVRRRLLEEGLSCSSVWVRDGAGLGLASMDDPRAVPALRNAIEREQCGDLRDDLRQVLDQLEATLKCRS